jgi:tellurite resistance protein TehA-like permease
MSMLPFLKGFTLLFWATATWWIPMLLVLGVWRYVMRKIPLTYDPLYWGVVFPLAMYTTATYRLAEALPAPYLMFIPRIMVGAALTAWLMTFLGLIGELTWHRQKQSQRSTSNVTSLRSKADANGDERRSSQAGSSR